MRRALHLVLLLSCAAAVASQSTEKVNQDSLALKDFSRREASFRSTFSSCWAITFTAAMALPISSRNSTSLTGLCWTPA